MSIAVISDLHLGARTSTDSFGHDDSEFIRFLRFLEQNFQRVVLLGDIWETLTTPLPRGHAEELRQARQRHRELAAYLARPRFTYIHGNHDLIAGKVDGVPGELQMKERGVRLLFAHGHQSDALVMRARPLSEIGVCLGGWIRRAGLHAAYKVLSKLDDFRSEHSSDKASKVESWAIQHARQQGADVVVTGHTHRGRVSEHGSRLFLNSGSCSEGKISFLSLDPGKGRYAIHDSY